MPLHLYERTSMNEQERSELDWLKRRQARLEQELTLLSKQLEVFESRLSRPEPETPKAPAAPQSPRVKPIEIPRAEVRPAVPQQMPPPIPPLIPPVIPRAPVFA